MICAKYRYNGQWIRQHLARIGRSTMFEKKMIRNTTFAPFLLAFLLLLAACGGESSSAEQPGLDATLEAAGIIETRAPVPTATPGVISEAVEEVAERIHVADVTFLGLTGEDWINFAVSLVFILIGYVVGSWTSSLAIRWGSSYLKDDESKILLKKVGRILRWLIVLIAFQLASVRLEFFSPTLKRALGSVYFIIGLLLIARGVWHLIDIADLEIRVHLQETNREKDLSPALILAVRVLRVLLVVITVSALLSHFGINMTAFAALLGLTGLAFSLAARDTIEDAIAGVIILADQPFRIGDRIEIAAANTWGDVVDIGLRTTRIRTRDNRLVIIPNSLISKNEIINYTYPDPTYRIETQVGLDYDTDIERAREIMANAVREVPNVLEDRPIDVLYSDMGESAMIFRVRWWIETYADTRRVTDEVHTALQAALDKAGIQTPFPTQSIYMHGEPSE